MSSQKFYIKIHKAFIVICSVVLCGCSPLYIPSSRVVNNFSSRGELNGSAMIDLWGAEASATYALSNHVMIHGAFSKSLWWLLNESDTSDIYESEGNHDHRMLEIGLGYYGKIQGKKFELEAGYSAGKSKVFEDVSSYSESARWTYPSRVIIGEYNRLYAQCGTVWLETEKITMGAVVRFSRLKFSRIESESTGFVFDKQNRFYLLEPAVSLKINISNSPLYLLLNGGMSLRTDKGPRRADGGPEYWAITNSLGLAVHIGRSRSTNRQ